MSRFKSKNSKRPTSPPPPPLPPRPKPSTLTSTSTSLSLYRKPHSQTTTIQSSFDAIKHITTSQEQIILQQSITNRQLLLANNDTVKQGLDVIQHEMNATNQKYMAVLAVMKQREDSASLERSRLFQALREDRQVLVWMTAVVAALCFAVGIFYGESRLLRRREVAFPVMEWMAEVYGGGVARGGGVEANGAEG
ncbi:hypothetical protein ABW19_dt0206225 [Dactylella cylindrospora]|nr:hypothetical protein ABW19_dt0206225 [Dactylella cylindrospora]